MTKLQIGIVSARNLRTSTGSTNTLLNLLDCLDENKYGISVLLVDDLVPKRLQISEKELIKDATYSSFEFVESNPKVKEISLLSEYSLQQLKECFDFIIISIYNEFGEDATLLGIFQALGIPSLSPSVKTSAVCFDKSFTKSILKASGLSVPKDIELTLHYNQAELKKKIEKEFKFPLIVKPASNGASRGASLVKNYSELSAAIKKGLNLSKEVLIEEYINGLEFSVGVTGHYLNAEALPVVMIKTKNDFFDYEAKYVPNMAEEICPAPINKETTKKLQTVALKAYKAVKADTFSRIDLILSEDKIYVLEINSFPGLLKTSIFPKELEVEGMGLRNFIDLTIRAKLNIN